MKMPIHNPWFLFVGQKCIQIQKQPPAAFCKKSCFWSFHKFHRIVPVLWSLQIEFFVTDIPILLLYTLIYYAKFEWHKTLKIRPPSPFVSHLKFNPMHTLTHFQPKFRFYTPWKHQETSGFLMFSGVTEVELTEFLAQKCPSDYRKVIKTS